MNQYLGKQLPEVRANPPLHHPSRRRVFARAQRNRVRQLDVFRNTNIISASEYIFHINPISSDSIFTQFRHND